MFLELDNLVVSVHDSTKFNNNNNSRKANKRTERERTATTKTELKQFQIFTRTPETAESHFEKAARKKKLYKQTICESNKRTNEISTKKEYTQCFVD